MSKYGQTNLVITHFLTLADMYGMLIRIVSDTLKMQLLLKKNKFQAQLGASTPMK